MRENLNARRRSSTPVGDVKRNLQRTYNVSTGQSRDSRAPAFVAHFSLRTCPVTLAGTPVTVA